MSQSEQHWLSAVEAGEQIARGDLTSVALTAAMLDRIERLDGALGSYAEVTAARAMANAEAADQELSHGARRSPLHGVPIAVKALADVTGIPTAAGTRVLCDNIAETDSTVVQRLADAGAVLLGSLTMTEGATSVHHPTIEQPKNPWDHDAWAGASSSGSGVATAAGLCFASLGSDTAGSIRAPSHFCGVAGLKPTYGRVSRAGIFPLSPSLDHIGPMARTVADCAAMLGAIAGPDERDPSARQLPVPDYLAELDRPLNGYRIGWDEAYVTDGVNGELAAAIEAAREVLQAAGAEIVAVELPPRSSATRAGALILHAEVALAHDPYYLDNKDQYGPHLAQIIEIGRTLSGVELARAHELRRQWNGHLDELFTSVDAVLCPPTVAPAPPARLTHGITGDFRTEGHLFAYTLPFNVSGHPALTVPAGFTEGGLPMAFQLVGRHFDEPGLLRAGHHYQQQTSWHDLHPRDVS